VASTLSPPPLGTLVPACPADSGLRRWLGQALEHARRLDLGRIRPIDLLWSGFALAMLGLMLLIPHAQTIPYHFIFASFTLLYGYRLWSSKVTVGLLLGLTLVPGLLFVHVYRAGLVSLDELAEIPLMPLIVGGMAYHAHRAASARRRVEEMALLESSRLDGQREFLRDTAHAIRTPVTIARGHIELIQMDSQDAQLRADTDEVLHQLDRLHHMARRLLVIEALRTSALICRETVDVSTLVADCGRRWSHSAPRHWVVEARDSAPVLVDRLRLEEALDAMIENALRFTDPGCLIRITCRGHGGWVYLEIADSGPGIAPEHRERVFDRFFHLHPVGEEPGTGLGLALVAAVAEVFGGSARVDTAPEGGALVTLRLPRS
jgi:signal transduction histidine kinase